jgi:magnesium transporter
MSNTRLQMLLESLRKLLRRNSHERVKKLLQKARHEDIASVMRSLDIHQQQQVFDLLPSDEIRAMTLGELDEHIFEDLIKNRPIEQVANILQLMSADDQAYVLASLEDELRQKLIGTLKPQQIQEVEEFLHYDRDTAGGLMSPNFLALTEETTCAQAIKTLQTKSEEVEMAFYVYVVNDNDQLMGVVSLRALVTNPPEKKLSQIAITDVISVKIEQDQEEVASLASRYNLLAVPVVDESNRLVGIVTIDDVIDVIREEATEDMLKMAGADESAFDLTSPLENFKTRAPWLFATWMGGLFASILIGGFEKELDQKVALAAFIPIVLGMGGNVGTQTATIMVRGLATGRVNLEGSTKYVLKESWTGAFLGIAYGILLAIYAWVTHRFSDDPVSQADSIPLAITVGLSIWASMMFSAMIGASTPILFNRLRIDPAVATGPLVTTAVDILGIWVYFYVAKHIMGI